MRWTWDSKCDEECEVKDTECVTLLAGTAIKYVRRSDNCATVKKDGLGEESSMSPLGNRQAVMNALTKQSLSQLG